MNYKNKYLKYKKKYLKLKFLNIHSGGRIMTNFNEIYMIYENIPKSGIYTDNIDKFKKFCKFLKNATISTEEIQNLLLKRKLENKKKTNTDEYKNIIKKISNSGKIMQKKGYDFELKCFKEIKKIFKDKKIMKNTNLYLKKRGSEDWILIGEIDAIILKDKQITNICEIKISLDDIPDALFQINRTFNTIKNKKLNEIKLVSNKETIILDDSYSIRGDFGIDIGYIFTHIDKTSLYFNIQSKIKHYLINLLHTRNIKTDKKFKKLLKKIRKKQESLDKITNTKIKRYNTDIYYLLNLLKDNNLYNHLHIINN